MKAVIKLVNKTSNMFGCISGLVLMFAAIITTYDVLLRSIAGVHTVWALEISQYSLLFATFMGAAFSLKEKCYICVDFAINRLCDKKRNLIENINSILIVILFSWLSYLSFSMTYQYFLKGWTTSTPMKVKLYLLILIISVGTAMVVLQQISDLLAKYFYKNETIN